MNSGDIIHVRTTTNGTILPTAVPSAGSISGNTTIASIGDQLFIYQGSAASPTFITGIHWNVEPSTSTSNWDNGATVLRIEIIHSLVRYHSGGLI